MQSKMQANDDDWKEYYEDNVGELMRHSFFRVVLDEGHKIRNKSSQSAFTSSSLACCSPLTRQLLQLRGRASTLGASTGGC